jgi:DNA processing protein
VIAVARGLQGDAAAALGLAWLGLSGGSCLLRLLKEVSPDAIWKASRRQLLAWGVGERATNLLVEKRQAFDVAHASARLDSIGQRFVPFGAAAYPAEFIQLESPPAGLFVRASEEALERLANAPRITVVGTRKATSEGLRTTEAFVSAFCSRGVAVISGMASGIDAQAHRTALKREGSTVAILGCGVDIVYPPHHHSLYEEMSESGVVASELPPGSWPTRWTFPHRNRLLAALGDAVLVVEGSNTSGALQTAKWALDLGRPVFSVPGCIYKEGAEGCNTLLYDGAAPALRPEVTVEDFLRETRNERGQREALGSCRVAIGEQAMLQSSASTSCRGRRVLEALDSGCVTVDELVVLTGLPVRELGAALGELEVTGMVIRGGPGVYLRAP